MRLARSQPRKLQVERLTEWFRSFTPGEMPAPGRDPLADLVLSQKGVCRHRARGFFVLALSLGIPTHLVVNEAHAFVEVWVPQAVGEQEGKGGWQRIDLGGGAESLELHGAQDKHLHQPQWRDPLPQPPAYAAQSGGGGGQTWAGAAQLKGADFSGNPSTTDIDARLKATGVDTLIVTGVSTSHCVYATCRDATDSFRVIVPREAVGERCELMHEVFLLDIDIDLADVTDVDEVVRQLARLAVA